MTNLAIQQITNKVRTSKKYGGIYRPTVERIVADLSKRYSSNDLEKEVKRKLHQIWGAYFTRPDFTKLLKKVVAQFEQGKEIQAVFDELLLLQSSTKERLSVLATYYADIFRLSGEPKSVVEYGCGVNVLSYPWFGCTPRYLGLDVDEELIDFTNAVLALAEISEARVTLGDVLVDDLPSADMALFLKVVPLLERQQEGVTRKLLQKQKSKWLIVSFPTKSLSGKSKGMYAHYRSWFIQMIKGENWSVQEIEYSNEIVFVVEK